MNADWLGFEVVEVSKEAFKDFLWQGDFPLLMTTVGNRYLYVNLSTHLVVAEEGPKTHLIYETKPPCYRCRINLYK